LALEPLARSALLTRVHKFWLRAVRERKPAAAAAATAPTVSYKSLKEVLDTPKGQRAIVFHNLMRGQGIQPEKTYKEVETFITDEMKLQVSRVCVCSFFFPLCIWLLVLAAVGHTHTHTHTVCVPRRLIR
jgi:hypothetical protein